LTQISTLSPVRTYRDFAAGQSALARVRELARDAAIRLLSVGRSLDKDNWIRFPYYHHVFDDERDGFARQLKYMAPIWLKRSDFKVRAFVEVVADYIQSGRIKLDPTVNKERVTYHDPCNQARSGNYIEFHGLILTFQR